MYYALMVFILLVVVFLIYSKLKMQTKQQRQIVRQQKRLDFLQALVHDEEKERSHIARDLHNEVSGMLAAVKMHFSSLPGADNLLQSENYRQGMQLLNEVSQEIRNTSSKLFPGVLIQNGLDAALNRYCAHLTTVKSLHIQYDSWGEISRFDPGCELSLYWAVQELVQHIIKQSKATGAIMQVSQQDGLLAISIEDNGIGFSNSNVDLRDLRSSIKAMNGAMEIESSQENGVSAYLEFEIKDLEKY